MVEGSRFPEVERWLEKEYPSVYEENRIYGIDWGIGVLLLFFGLFLGVVYNLTSNSLQIIGLVLIVLGIMIEVRVYILYLIKKKRYSYHGLSRETMSDAIMYLDIKMTRLEDIESIAPNHVLSKYLDYTLDESKQKIYRFLRLTVGLFVWPSVFINEIKVDIKDQQRRVRLYSILYFVLLLLSILIECLIIISGSESLLLIFSIPLLIVPFLLTYEYLRYYFNNLFISRDEWLSRILQSESISLKETMVEILTKLRTEFQYPLLFFLAQEYPLLNYTGRTDEYWGAPFLRLKEAILYPLSVAKEKEESTGA
ncbi:MAG: hypothetical protein ACFFBJ_01270 [Promethearchaeota archaeon]